MLFGHCAPGVPASVNVYGQGLRRPHPQLEGILGQLALVLEEIHEHQSTTQPNNEHASTTHVTPTSHTDIYSTVQLDSEEAQFHTEMIARHRERVCRERRAGRCGSYRNRNARPSWIPVAVIQSLNHTCSMYMHLDLYSMGVFVVLVGSVLLHKEGTCALGRLVRSESAFCCLYIFNVTCHLS